MTSNAQNTAIAGLLGKCVCGIEHWVSEGPDGDREIVCGKCGARPYTAGFPDYTRDLNAMHEAEKVLTDDEAWQQIQFIVSYQQHAGGFPVLSRSESRRLHSATAAQRAEAFLRTLNRWDDSK